MGDEGGCGKYSRYAYDAVSIRRMDAWDHRGSWKRLAGEGFISTGFPIIGMIATAYQIPFEQIISLPSWASDVKYAITAKMANDDLTPVLHADEALGTLYQLRLKSLLCERFMLRAHTEKRPFRAYRLVLKDTELKMSESTGTGISREMRAHGIKMTGATMSMIASQLSELIGETVIDSTNKPGRYEVVFTWNEDSDGNKPAIAADVISELKDVYGLKLVLSNDPLDVLVIDSISMPSPN